MGRSANWGALPPACLAKAANGPILGIVGWRWLLILAACGGLVVWLVRRGLPESPRWLAATGKTAEADRVATAIELEVLATRRPTSTEQVPTEPALAPSPPAAPASVPSDRYRRRTVLLRVMQIVQPIGFYGFASIAPIVLLAKGFDLTHSLTYSALTAFGYPLGSLVSVYPTERVERRTLLIASSLAVATFGVLFGLATASGLVVAAGIATTISVSCSPTSATPTRQSCSAPPTEAPPSAPPTRHPGSSAPCCSWP